jgi:hypothetical protein
VKPAPETVAALTVRLEPPVFFNVSVCGDVLPTTTLPKLILVGLVVRSPAATPAPESVTFVVPLAVTKAILPVALPIAVGAKMTLKFALCPTGKVKGAVTPLML